MPGPQGTDLSHAKRGVAVLALCIVQTANEFDPTFRERFLRRLDGLYRDLRDHGSDPNTEGLELLGWIADLVKQDRL